MSIEEKMRQTYLDVILSIVVHRGRNLNLFILDDGVGHVDFQEELLERHNLKRLGDADTARGSYANGVYLPGCNQVGKSGSEDDVAVSPASGPSSSSASH